MAPGISKSSSHRSGPVAVAIPHWHWFCESGARSYGWGTVQYSVVRAYTLLCAL
jgi:hypothetical protein